MRRQNCGSTEYGQELLQELFLNVNRIFSRQETVSVSQTKLRVALSTNQSGFSYTLNQIDQNAAYSINGAAILYSNSPLQNCTVSEMNFKAAGPAFKRPGACQLNVYPTAPVLT